MYVVTQYHISVYIELIFQYILNGWIQIRFCQETEREKQQTCHQVS